MLRRVIGWMLLGLWSCVFTAVGQELLPMAQEPAQEEAAPALSEELLLEMSERMEGFLSELTELSEDIPQTKTANALAAVRRRLTSLNVRWDAYNTLMQMDIAQSELLMELVAQFQTSQQQVTEAMDQQQLVLEAIVRFREVERQFPNYEKRYEELEQEAISYSLIAKTADLLAQVKGKEQLLFQEVDQQFMAAKEAVALVPALTTEGTRLENRYLVLKQKSEAIQAAAYKSLIERIKDYVMTFAAVAIILMFFSMVQSKLKALKAARENAKQYQEMLQKNNSEIPTI
ncbi:hypothetical protein JQM84_07255 [Parabacteroides distasonis]|nr:hypothetical protein [Parabacteroides distasonis]